MVVTGGPDEQELTARVAAAGGTDPGGRTDLAGLARVPSGARCLVVGNTGPAHLAAAVRTPVVSLFAPTVPFGQWGPYRVPTVDVEARAVQLRERMRRQPGLETPSPRRRR